MPRHAIFVGAIIFTGIRFIFYPLFPSLFTLLTATLIFSLGTVEFECIPENMRGRVFGTVTAGVWVARPLGMLLGGFFTEKFGVVPMLIFLATAFIIVTISMAFIPAMKEMNRVEGRK